jgi:hypothetical protein
VTEADWNNSTEPQKMIEALRASGKASDRKLRLFAVACCRRLLHLLPEWRHRRHVEVAELYADGKAGEEELGGARTQWPWGFSLDPGPGSEPDDLTWLASDRAAEVAAQAGLVRCIFNPFRPLPQLPASLLQWHDGIIPKMANAIYDERDLPSGHLRSDRLAVLADGLQDAGCEDAELLGHLRGGGVHVRGCWGVDVVLGRQ